MNRTSSALFAAALVSLSLLAATPATAGTEAAPEITDPQNDIVFTPNGQATAASCVPSQVPEDCPTFGRMDTLKVWIDGENATHIVVNALMFADPSTSANAYSWAWEFRMKLNGTEYIASASANGGQTPTATAVGGVATAIAFDGNKMSLTVPKTAFGAAAVAGAQLVDLFAVGTALSPPPTPPTVLATDRAPDGAAFGTPYNFTTGGSTCSTCTATDLDGDGLSNEWENQYFGGNNATASGDPDSDALNNTQEQALGTNPTKADTDDDGFNDGAEVLAGTDPKDASSHPETGTNPPPPPPPPPSSDGTDGTSDQTSGAATSRSLTDKLTGDPQYVGIAAGGAIVILIVSLIGRFGRWGL